MKTMTMLVSLALLTAGGVRAEAVEWKVSDCLVGTIGKASHAPGEEMVFEVDLRGFAGLDRGTVSLVWERTGDDGKKASGKAALTEKFVYRTSLDRPGFVRLFGTLVGPDGKPVMQIANGKPRNVTCDLGAGVEVLKIRQAVPEPADFDAFWAKHKANLASVPWKENVTLKEIASPTEGMRLYEFSVPCCGGKPATGHLAVPEDTTRKYPAAARFFGYNESWTYKRSIRPPEKLAKDWVYMYVSAHGFEMGHDEAYYKAERQKAKSNGFGHGFDPEQNDDPEKTYYAGMTYRVMRALEYLKSRPEWNGKDLLAVGGSQGGIQSIWAGALVPGVSEVRASIPWNCDIGGTELGRNRGDWYVKWVPALGYYDACNHGKRIPKTCKLVVPGAGMGDYTCPPTGVLAFYNAVTAPKEMTLVQNMEHGRRLQPPPLQSFVLEGDGFRESK